MMIQNASDEAIQLI